MSGEVSASYPGRAGNLLQEELPLLKSGGKGTQQSAEGIVAATPRCEGPKREEKDTANMSLEEADAATREEAPAAVHRGGVRNTPGRGEAASNPTVVKEPCEPACKEEDKDKDNDLAALMPRILARENMLSAYRAVKHNAGAAGVDRLQVEALRPWLKEHWEQTKADLLEGRYKPQAVRRVDIPKPGGGTRTLGIPTVCDRLIQQAIHQVLSPLWEGEFSEHSHGFRPNRSAHQAVQAARAHVEAGYRWVVDIDLEKFFDRVNHDLLMSRIARKVKDKTLLRLIRRYLEAGMMKAGIVEPRTEGTPQGGPLSPLLSNILLDDLDKELERRSHRFERYADDCNIYVKSKAAGERVLASVTKFVEKKLKLKVNTSKSGVDRPWKRKFLGYSMTFHRKPRLKAASSSVERFKDKVRALRRQARGRNLRSFIQKDLNPLLRGWATYHRLAEVKGIFEELDAWVRRKLRCAQWRQWKRGRTRMKELVKQGLEPQRASENAFNGRGPWWNAGAPHMNAALPTAWFRQRGLVFMSEIIQRYQKKA
jgi:RNA-directed DNA polymerase